MRREAIVSRVTNNIRRLMNEKGLNQTELATELDVHYQSINRLISGKHYPNATAISRLCAVFRVDVAEFFKPCGPIELTPNGRKK